MASSSAQLSEPIWSDLSCTERGSEAEEQGLTLSGRRLAGSLRRARNTPERGSLGCLCGEGAALMAGPRGLWLSWLQTEQHLRKVGENRQEVAEGTRAGAGDGLAGPSGSRSG